MSIPPPVFYKKSGSIEPPPLPSHRRVTPDDFKGANVQKAVLSECVQHPATILPAAGSVVAAASIAVISASPGTIGAAVGLIFVSISAFVYNYVIKGEDRAGRRINDLRELRRQQLLFDADMLAYQCRSAQDDACQVRCDSLKQSYLDLQQYLKAHTGTSADGFNALAEETLKQGLTTLGRALEIFKAIKAVEKSSQSSAPSSLRKDRLDMIAKEESELSELLAQADQIETALQKTHLELAAFGQADPSKFFDNDGGAAARLKDAVEAARRVENSLRGDSYQDAELRKKYLA